MSDTKKAVSLIALALSALLPLGLPAVAKAAKAAVHHHTAKPASSQAAPSDADFQNTWHLDPALAAQLGTAYPMLAFSIRPPQGYTVDQESKERDTDNVFLFDWNGPARSDGSAAELSVQLTKLKPDVVTIYTLDDRLDQLFDQLKQDSPWIQNSPYEHGLINNSSFVRSYFKDGPDTPAGKPINHGFVYKATSNDAKYLITIVAHDTEPDNAASLPLLEASVLTFRMR